MLSNADEFKNAAAELFDEFVGSEPNAYFERQIVDNPVTGVVSHTRISVRAIVFSKTTKDGTTDTRILLLVDEFVDTPNKGDTVFVDGTRYIIQEPMIDPAQAVWEIVVHVS